MPDIVTVGDSASSIAAQIFVDYYSNLIGITILYYDYSLTLGDEVKYFWGKGPTTLSVLFFLNRYISILGTIPVLLQVFGSWSSQGCNNFQKYHQFLALIVQIVVAVVMILRTYALYELNRKILVALVLLAVIIICAGLTSVVGKNPVVVLPYDVSALPGCCTLLSDAAGFRLAGSWGGLLLFDTIIVFLTLRKALVFRRLQSQTLFYVIIRDGTIYYAAFSLINLAQILVFVMGAPKLKGFLTTFANVISSTLISRLMLNLRNPRLFGSSQAGGTTLTTLGEFVASRYNETRSESSAGFTSYGDTLHTVGSSDVESGKSPLHSDQQQEIELIPLGHTYRS